MYLFSDLLQNYICSLARLAEKQESYEFSPLEIHSFSETTSSSSEPIIYTIKHLIFTSPSILSTTK